MRRACTQRHSSPLPASARAMAVAVAVAPATRNPDAIFSHAAPTRAPVLAHPAASLQPLRITLRDTKGRTVSATTSKALQPAENKAVGTRLASVLAPSLSPCARAPSHPPSVHRRGQRSFVFVGRCMRALRARLDR